MAALRHTEPGLNSVTRRRHYATRVRGYLSKFTVGLTMSAPQDEQVMRIMAAIADLQVLLALQTNNQTGDLFATAEKAAAACGLLTDTPTHVSGRSPDVRHPDRHPR